uniref:PEP-utilizing enzyme n=1 Tax=Desertifilum tharense IPPAS B-1220 TaxID=1781255 RepID=A0ACD5H2R9_9CYAN
MHRLWNSTSHSAIIARSLNIPAIVGNYLPFST